MRFCRVFFSADSHTNTHARARAHTHTHTYTHTHTHTHTHLQVDFFVCGGREFLDALGFALSVTTRNVCSTWCCMVACGHMRRGKGCEQELLTLGCEPNHASLEMRWRCTGAQPCVSAQVPRGMQRRHHKPVSATVRTTPVVAYCEVEPSVDEHGQRAQPFALAKTR
jgi:hypothetical protein